MFLQVLLLEPACSKEHSNVFILFCMLLKAHCLDLKPHLCSLIAQKLSYYLGTRALWGCL